MYEADSYESKAYDNAIAKVEKIGKDYTKSIEKIFQPFKESIPNYDLFIERMTDDFYDDLYGYGY